MKNREWLRSMALYDLLCRISDYGETMNDDFCIVDTFGGYGAICNGDCKKCLQTWLNYERKEGE